MSPFPKDNFWRVFIFAQPCNLSPVVGFQKAFERSRPDFLSLERRNRKFVLSSAPCSCAFSCFLVYYVFAFFRRVNSSRPKWFKVRGQLSRSSTNSNLYLQLKSGAAFWLLCVNRWRHFSSIFSCCFGYRNSFLFFFFSRSRTSLFSCRVQSMACRKSSHTHHYDCYYIPSDPLSLPRSIGKRNKKY